MSSRPPQLPDQATVRTALRIAGPAVFGIGLLFTVIGFASFFSAFNSLGATMPTNFWMAFIGMPLMGAGGWMIRVGYLGPATRYVAGEVSPTIKETLSYMGVGAATVTCAKCGGANNPDAKFCDDCGAALGLTCPACGQANAPDATFCNQCGKPLTTA